MLRMVSARSGSRRVWCFAIHIKPGGVCGRRFKEQHCVRFGAVKCARIEESHAVDALVADFVGVTMEQHVYTRVEKAFYFALKMTVREADAQRFA